MLFSPMLFLCEDGGLRDGSRIPFGQAKLPSLHPPYTLRAGTKPLMERDRALRVAAVKRQGKKHFGRHTL